MKLERRAIFPLSTMLLRCSSLSHSARKHKASATGGSRNESLLRNNSPHFVARSAYTVKNRSMGPLGHQLRNNQCQQPKRNERVTSKSPTNSSTLRRGVSTHSIARSLRDCSETGDAPTARSPRRSDSPKRPCADACNV